MTLRRALWASPLAVAVAVLAHFVTFGFGHAPGSGHAFALIGTLAATLLIGLIGSFTGGFFARAPRRAERSGRYAPFLLAAAGAAAFGIIELSEGHVAFPAFLVAGIAALPLAFLVLSAARSAERLARTAGARSAAFVHRVRRVARVATATFLDSSRPSSARGIFARTTRQGRAPPVSL
ncbi:MAG: hypothetical protein IAI50_01295 [Candidatus Eremiobacteraeota bacterium]|nr:hypothetical protein [Candidatus Eremiobacteraeota bacterium]